MRMCVSARASVSVKCKDIRWPFIGGSFASFGKRARTHRSHARVNVNVDADVDTDMDIYLKFAVFVAAAPVFSTRALLAYKVGFFVLCCSSLTSIHNSGSNGLYAFASRTCYVC